RLRPSRLRPCASALRGCALRANRSSFVRYPHGWTPFFSAFLCGSLCLCGELRFFGGLELKYGLIAGNGRFPFLVLQAARDQGLDVAVAAIREETAPEIEAQAAVVEWMGVGQLGRLIRFFKREQITHAIMAGQVK